MSAAEKVVSIDTELDRDIARAKKLAATAEIDAKAAAEHLASLQDRKAKLAADRFASDEEAQQKRAAAEHAAKVDAHAKLVAKLSGWAAERDAAVSELVDLAVRFGDAATRTGKLCTRYTNLADEANQAAREIGAETVSAVPFDEWSVQGLVGQAIRERISAYPDVLARTFAEYCRF